MSNKARNRPTTGNPAVRAATKESRGLKKQLSDAQVDGHRMKKALDAVLGHNQALRTDLETTKAREASLQSALAGARGVLAGVMLELGADEVYITHETMEVISGGRLLKGIEVRPEHEGETQDVTVSLSYLEDPLVVEMQEVEDEDPLPEVLDGAGTPLA